MDVLERIVKLLQANYMRGDKETHTFNGLMGLLKFRNIESTKQVWLETEGLPSHKLVECVNVSGEAKLYGYKPPIPCASSQELLVYLKGKALNNQGGTLMLEILESVPKATAALSKLKDAIYITETQKDVKVVFYDTSKRISEEDVQDVDLFRSLWASDDLEGINDYKLAEKLRIIGLKPTFNPQLVEELRKKKQPFIREMKRSLERSRSEYEEDHGSTLSSDSD